LAIRANASASDEPHRWGAGGEVGTGQVAGQVADDDFDAGDGVPVRRPCPRAAGQCP
jgi:hypothetical protein